MSPTPTDNWGEKIARIAAPFTQFRLGAGVLGRTGSIAAAFLFICLVALIELPGLWKLIPFGAAFIAFLFYQVGSLRFATNDPAAALLGGARFERAFLQDARAKEMPEVLEGRVVRDPLAVPAPQFAAQTPKTGPNA